MNDLLEKAIDLRSSGQLKKANEMLHELVKKYPNDAQVNYQCAWSFDVLGLEKEAVPYYEKAIELGLPDSNLQEAYLGLGSTYRTIGEYEKSKHLLQEAIKKFDTNSLRVFLAMTLYNLEEHAQAMDLLLTIIATTSKDESIIAYKNAINFYSNNLDQLW